MSRLFILFLLIFLFVPEIGAEEILDLEVVKILPHHGRGEGLDYYDGFLWETEGNDKIIKKINPQTGETTNFFSSPTLYPESLVWMEKNKFIHIDFKRKDVVVGKFDKKKRLRFELLGDLTELGFGLAKKDEKSFWVSGHFSPKIQLYSYPQLQLLYTINTGLKAVEDLAWDGESIWASDYHDKSKKKIYRINPQNGTILNVYRIPGKEACERIDGIAIGGEQIFVTGKSCPLYVIKYPITNSRIPASKSKNKAH